MAKPRQLIRKLPPYVTTLIILWACVAVYVYYSGKPNAPEAPRKMAKDTKSPVSLAESSCGSESIQEHTEYWGEIVVAGELPPSSAEKGLETASPQECCRACTTTRGCNVWVWCANPARCRQQCWLKRVPFKTTEVQVHDKGPDVPWTSGVVPKDYDRDLTTLPPVDPSISIVTLNTTFGAIRIQLKPEWSESSVLYLRQLAMTPSLCTTQCEFYRAEENFLLQGSLRAFIPPNNVTTPGPKIMERGEIGWAGGFAGPDFFIYLGKDPATHWERTHTVWGVLADEASFKVAETINAQKATSPTPGGMHMLDKRVPFTPGRQ